MVSFHTTCWTTARLPPPSTADDFDRPVCEVEKLAQVCGIDSSLSPRLWNNLPLRLRDYELILLKLPKMYLVSG